MNRRLFIKLGLSSLVTGVLSYVFIGKGFSKGKVNRVEASPKVGINLGAINYYSSEWPLSDIFKHAAEIGPDQDVTLDHNGELTRIPLGKRASRIVYVMPDDVNVEQYVKPGRYLLLYEGEAAVYTDMPKVGMNTLYLGSDVHIVSQSAQKLVFDLTTQHSFSVSIASLDPKAPIKNIRIIPVEIEHEYLGNRWDPKLLDLLDGFACIRFMDMMKTNNSMQVTWDNRPKEQDAVYSTEAGCPLPLLVDLVNKKQVDPWFCIPHLADDNYVVEFARYLKRYLNPALKAYIEYSNETWNGGFEQHAYAKKQAMALGFGENANKFTAHRSIQIFDIFGQVYGDERPKRIVRVLASQASWSEVSKARLNFMQAYQKVDVLAIAPYISLMVGPEHQARVAGWTLDNLFDYVNKTALPESINWMRSNKQIADEYGVQLVAYEGGQHMVGVGGVENNDAITKLFIAANNDLRMESVYAQYLDAWAHTGGGLFCHYNFIGGWSKWGAWSLLRSKYQLLATSPKWQAIAKWANKHEQGMRL